MKITRSKIEKIIREEVQRSIKFFLEASDVQAYVGDVAIDVSPEQRAQMIQSKIAADTEDEKESCKPGSDSSQCKADGAEVSALQSARSKA